MELLVLRDVEPIVVEDVELNIAVVATVEVVRVKRPCLRGDAVRVRVPCVHSHLIVSAVSRPRTGASVSLFRLLA